MFDNRGQQWLSLRSQRSEEVGRGSPAFKAPMKHHVPVPGRVLFCFGGFTPFHGAKAGGAGEKTPESRTLPDKDPIKMVLRGPRHG
jgi:hypothetical protein